MAKLLNGEGNVYELPGQDEVPEADRVRFRFRTPTVYDRARHNRAVGRLGARMHPNGVLYARAREALAEIFPEGGEDAGRFTEAIDRLEAGEEDADTAALYSRLEEQLIASDPAYAGLVADRQFWLEIAPIEAFRLFCTGWDNAEPAWRAGPEGVHEDVIAGLPANDVALAGFHAMALLRPTRDEAKNSASPSGSAPGRAASTAANGSDPTGPSDTATPPAGSSATPG